MGKIRTREAEEWSVFLGGKRGLSKSVESGECVANMGALDGTVCLGIHSIHQIHFSVASDYATVNQVVIASAASTLADETERAGESPKATQTLEDAPHTSFPRALQTKLCHPSGGYNLVSAVSLQLSFVCVWVCFVLFSGFFCF